MCQNVSASVKHHFFPLWSIYHVHVNVKFAVEKSSLKYLDVFWKALSRICNMRKIFYLKSIPLENKIYFRGWGTPKLLMGVSTHMSCGKLYWDILQSTARSTACKELARNRIYFKGARLHHKGSPRNISIGNYLLDGYRIFWRRVMRFLLVMIVQDCISGTLLSIGPFTWHKEFRASIKIPHVLFILISRFCWLYWSQ